jgi:hypothetical protein
MANNGFTITVPVGASALERFVLVKTIAGVVVTAANTDIPLGVVQDAAAANDASATIVISGPTLVQAGAAVSKGDIVSPTSAGECISHAGSQTRIGFAMEAAAAQGDLFWIYLFDDKAHTAVG